VEDLVFSFAIDLEEFVLCCCFFYHHGDEWRICYVLYCCTHCYAMLMLSGLCYQ